jgi:hypothetical protein
METKEEKYLMGTILIGNYLNIEPRYYRVIKETKCKVEAITF